MIQPGIISNHMSYDGYLHIFNGDNVWTQNDSDCGQIWQPLANNWIDNLQECSYLLTQFCIYYSFQSTSSLESNLEGLASVLESDLPNYKQKIMRILCEWLVPRISVIYLFSCVNLRLWKKLRFYVLQYIYTQKYTNHLA